MDTNKDGKLSPAEFDVLKKTAPYFREHPEAVAGFFKRLDENGDGMLSLDEYRKVGQRKRAADTPVRPSGAAVSSADKSVRFTMRRRAPFRRRGVQLGGLIGLMG